MARTVPADALAALQANWRQVQVLLELDTAAPKYYAAGAVDILHGGNTYKAREFSVGPLQYGAPGQAGTTVVVDNRDSELSNMAYLGEVGGDTLTLTWLVRNSPDEDWATGYEVADAVIAEASGGGSTNITLQLRGDRRLTSRPMGAGPCTQSCRHRAFKGTRCKYASSDTTCTRTWEDCTAKSNTVNFGGVRHAPRVGESIELATGRPTIVSRPPYLAPAEPTAWTPTPRVRRGGRRVSTGGRRQGARRVGG